MEKLLTKYADKLYRQGLCEKDAPLLGGIDAEILWNREDPRIPLLEEVIGGLNINSLLFAAPREPYFSLIEYLAAETGPSGSISPQDSETRTFLHDIPVIADFSAPEIIAVLKRRKAVIIRGHGLVTFGIVSPEQAFIVFSSVCFACYVKFFADSYYARKKGPLPAERRELLARAYGFYRSSIAGISERRVTLRAPFADSEAVLQAIIEAGRLTVECGMVDSFFGNVSLFDGEILYISQTGSSLDELAGCIDPCPADGSSCAGLTASSEYKAHREIYRNTGMKTVLHGHPRFSVILSMICDEEECPRRGSCFKDCRKERFIDDIPIVPGEVGTGPTGLCNTLPPAMIGRRGVIVYGHGLFTVGREDFSDAFENLKGIEARCFEEYGRLMDLA
mgnify:CR=1 FL=1